MFERASSCLRRITGITTPFGGLSWSPSSTLYKKVPKFRFPIYITTPGNEEFISFIEAYSKRVVFLDSYIDASVATEEQHEMVRREEVPIEKVASGSFSGALLPLPNNRRSIISIAFDFCDNRTLNCSQGGTGIVTVDVSGFYEVSQTWHGGPMTVFHLKEIDASVEAKLSISKH